MYSAGCVCMYEYIVFTFTMYKVQYRTLYDVPVLVLVYVQGTMYVYMYKYLYVELLCTLYLVLCTGFRSSNTVYIRVHCAELLTRAIVL